MFTGIIETTAHVAALTLQEQGGRLALEHVTFAHELTMGESVAVNGCCLTVVEFGPGHCAFDLLGETLRLTNLGNLTPGQTVNLERAMRADTRFSGHFVQGHVDTTAEVIRYAQHGQDHEFTIRIPAGGRNFLLHKGSICLDGMSLTVAELQQEQLTIWITPHTHSVTTLQHLQAGARVNVEYDMFAKYLDKMLAARQAD